MHQRVAVNDKSTCQKAAEELSGSSMSVMASGNGENWPNGCYLQRSNTKVFFNEHKTGSKNDDAYQLCRFGGKGKNCYFTCFQLLIYYYSLSYNTIKTGRENVSNLLPY